MTLLVKLSKPTSSVTRNDRYGPNGAAYYSVVLTNEDRSMLLMKFLMAPEGERPGVTPRPLNNPLYMHRNMLDSRMMTIKQVTSSRPCFLQLVTLRASSVGMNDM